MSERFGPMMSHDGGGIDLEIRSIYERMRAVQRLSESLQSLPRPFVLDGWGEINLAQNTPLQRMARFGETVNNQLRSAVAAHAGRIRGIALHWSNGVTAGTFTVEVYVDGAATGLISELGPTAGGGTKLAASSDPTMVAAGSIIDLRWQTTSDFAPNATIDVIAALNLELFD